MLSAPWALGLLALLPVVVALHLRRRRSVEVSSLVVWQRIGLGTTTAARRWATPTSLLSLILQLGVVTLVALALARPTLGTEVPLNDLVIVLDTSLPMLATDVAPNRSARARDAALDHLQDLVVDGTRVTLVEVRDRARIVAVAVAPGQAAAHLERLEPSEVRADWTTLTSALAAIALPEGRRSAIHLWTTPQDAPYVRNELDRQHGTTDVTVHTVGGDTAFVNAGIESARLIPRGNVSGRWTIEGTITSVGVPPSTPVRVQAMFEPAGTVGALSWGTSDVVLDRSGTTPFSVPIDLPGPGVLELRLPGGDHLATDDRYVLVAMPEREPSVLLLGQEHSSVERALLAMPGIVAYWAPSLPDDLEPFDLIIVDGDVVLDRLPTTPTLWLNTHPAAVPSAPSSSRTSDVLRPDRWSADHHVTRGSDWFVLEVPRDAYRGVPPSWDPLVTASDATLIAARTDERGRHVAVGFDIMSTTWPAQASFPTFIAASLDWALQDHAVVGERAPCRTGRACALPAAALDPTWSIVGPDGEIVAQPFGWRTDAADALVIWPEGVFETQFLPTRAGRHDLRSPRGTFVLPVAPIVVVEPGASSERLAAEAASLPRAPRTWWVLLATAAVVFVLADTARAAVGMERWLTVRRWRRNEPRHRYLTITALTALAIASGVLAVAQLPTPSLQDARVDIVLGPEVGSARAASRALEAALARVGERQEANVVLRAPSTLPWPVDRFHHDVRMLSDERVRFTLADTPEPTGDRVVIERFVSPPRVRAGDVLDVRFTVSNDTSSAAALQLWFGGQAPVSPVSVPPGRSTVEVTITAPVDAGPVSLGIITVIDDEELTLLDTHVWVEGQARVLVVTSEPDHVAPLAAALRLHGVEVEVDLPRRMPNTLERLGQYDVVALADVAAVSVHTFYQELLEAWVRTRAGGLVMLGGRSSFGAGGYLLTPLDTVSPVSSRVPDEAPEVTIVFVLDTSGSMSARVGDATRLAVAQEATVSALDLVNPESLIGIVTFAAEGEVIAPITPARERALLVDAVARLQPGGGTAIYEGLVEAARLVSTVDSAAVHVIVMTDGISQPGDFEGVLGDLRSKGATTSFIGIGDGADQGQLSRLANLGGGRLHFTRDFRALPGIMAQETTAAAVDAVEDRTVSPDWTQPRPGFAASLPAHLPPLGGYVRTTLKPGANLHLSDVALDAPLMASWRYGAGRVAAFTSDPVGEWGIAWLEDESLQALWAQLVRWAASGVVRSGASLRTWSDTSVLHVLADILDEEGRPVTGLRPTLRIVDDGDTRPPLAAASEVRPGVYHTVIEIEPDLVGQLLEFVGGTSAPNFVRPVQLLVPPATPARDWASPGSPRLAHLADATSARIVSEDAWSGGLGSGRRTLVWDGSPVSWLWLCLAAFVASLVLRYAPPSFAWLARAVTAVRSVRSSARAG